MQGNQSTVDPAEVAKFEAMAAEWWDLEGKFKPLHMLNPCRLDYITQQISMEFDRDLSADLPFKGLRILDIGCGGGLLCEPMARLGQLLLVQMRPQAIFPWQNCTQNNQASTLIIATSPPKPWQRRRNNLTWF